MFAASLKIKLILVFLLVVIKPQPSPLLANPKTTEVFQNYAIKKFPEGVFVRLRKQFPKIKNVDTSAAFQVKFIVSTLRPVPADWKIMNDVIQGDDGKFYVEETGAQSTFVVFQLIDDSPFVINSFWLDETSLVEFDRAKKNSAFIESKRLKAILPLLKKHGMPPPVLNFKDYTALEVSPAQKIKVLDIFPDKNFAGKVVTVNHLIVGLNLRDKTLENPTDILLRDGKYYEISLDKPQYLIVPNKKTDGTPSSDVLIIDCRWLDNTELIHQVNKSPFANQGPLLTLFEKNFSKREEFGVPAPKPETKAAGKKS